MNIDDIKKTITIVHDYPIPGIIFRDITTLLEDPKAFKATVDIMVEKVSGLKFDRVVGIESRGFFWSAPIAYALSKPFVLARKPGKLPRRTVSKEFILEYNIYFLSSSLCLHVLPLLHSSSLFPLFPCLLFSACQPSPSHFFLPVAFHVVTLCCTADPISLAGPTPADLESTERLLDLLRTKGMWLASVRYGYVFGALASGGSWTLVERFDIEPCSDFSAK